jgi:hypothetical protein
VAEGVHIYDYVGGRVKFLLKILAADGYLTDEGLATRHEAIGLEIPTAHNVPFALFYKPLNAGKKVGRILFYRFVQERFVMAEYIVKLIGKVSGGSEGRYRGGYALVPRPLPYGVDVRVTYKVKLFHMNTPNI